MSKQTLDFWFEFASSYSYLSVMRIEALAREAKVTVVWRPFLLGPVFLSLGWNDSPFNIYPPKGRYMWRDLARLSGKYGLPFQVPSRFPRNGLLAARVALTGADQPWIGDFTRAVMQANFAQDREIAEPAVIEEILTRLNLPAAALLEQANSPENKQAL
nr:2-hydroxychromene-2-carboxylate isomerase [Zoogloea sp.]